MPKLRYLNLTAQENCLSSLKYLEDNKPNNRNGEGSNNNHNGKQNNNRNQSGNNNNNHNSNNNNNNDPGNNIAASMVTAPTPLKNSYLWKKKRKRMKKSKKIDPTMETITKINPIVITTPGAVVTITITIYLISLTIGMKKTIIFIIVNSDKISLFSIGFYTYFTF
jgi:hypothetical protein